jgi:hypothetical protein
MPLMPAFGQAAYQARTWSGSEVSRTPYDEATGTLGPGTSGNSCRCGHHPDAHRHYRPGTDCGLCECLRWSRYGGLKSWPFRGLAGLG